MHVPACYQQTNSFTCRNLTANGCMWTDQNQCAPKNSCRAGGNFSEIVSNVAVVTESNCLLDQGCSWNSANNSCNTIDFFPYNQNEWADSDFDGVGNNSDAFPMDPTESLDSDNDGIGNNADQDDDNDGVPDLWDSESLRAGAFWDIDNDGLSQDVDPDHDNDGVPNQWDDLFWRVGAFDIDDDFIANEFDDDIDGDGFANNLDAFPWENTEWEDTDSDNIGNNRDQDDDNDGIPDQWDDFSLNAAWTFDSDGDGFANEVDAFPLDPTEWLDSDGDGVGDNADAFPFNPDESSDTDGDGVGDNSDPDIDGDGFPNQLPVIPNVPECYLQNNANSCTALSSTLGCTWTTQGQCAPRNSCEGGGNFVQFIIGTAQVNQVTCNQDPGCQWISSPVQTVCRTRDQFPFDSEYRVDSDFDSIPDEIDQDNDNDGVPNQWDTFVRSPEAFADIDFDGLIDFAYSKFPTVSILDKVDPDRDNNGTPDFWDDLPFTEFESFDIDGDGIGNNSDLDIDGDGVPNQDDDFPWDSNETEDPDGDNIGNNADPDDDNDGVPDPWDTLSTNEFGFSDYSGNGVPDQVSLDIDADGFSNGSLSCDPTMNPDEFICSYPDSIDLFPWDETEWFDSDLDSIGNNADPDDDNDGVPDPWDDLPFNSNGFSDLDGDGIPNEIDPDVDGDGFANDIDLFPFDPNEWADNDLDGIGNNADQDDDNDGVPDFWDQFPDNIIDPYWSDRDEDGIPDEEDVNTPNGINNEADIMIAVANSEPIALSTDITVSNQINLTWDGASIFSPNEDEVRELVYNLPDDQCMVRISSQNAFIESVKFVMPAGKKGTFICSDDSNSSPTNLGIYANEFSIKGVAKIARMNIGDLFFFVRNTTVLSTTIDLGLESPVYHDLITLKKRANTPVGSRYGFYFAANIIFWDINTPQTSPFSFFRTDGAMNFINFDLNLVNLKNNSGQELPTGTAVFNFDYVASAFEDKGVSVSANRLNLNGDDINETGFNVKLFNAISTSNAYARPEIVLEVVASSNQVNGLVDDIGNTTLGTPILDKFFDEERVLFCLDLESSSECNSVDYCQWRTDIVPNYCAIRISEQPDSFESYRNFTKEETFVDPDAEEYWMFYYPDDAAVENSPALYDTDFYLGDAETNGFGIDLEVYVISPYILGNFPQINYIGAYPPALDTDGDGVRDSYDDFPLDPTEWRDSDSDGIGNNADTNDDIDLLLDVNEHSLCKIFDRRNLCQGPSGGINPNPGCLWSEPKKACTRDPEVQGCYQGDWNQSQGCCTNPFNPTECIDGTDPYSEDTDDDGILDHQELSIGTNPLLSDTDGDGVPDGQELIEGTNPLDPLSFLDTDSDGIPNFVEINVHGTNPNEADSDFDGLSDFDEINIHGTNPNAADSDGDGVPDNIEIAQGTDPNDENDFLDTDGDGFPDYVEIQEGSDPNDPMSFPTITIPIVMGLIQTPYQENQPIYKDSDGDSIEDHLDLSPFGMTPCSNENLSGCQSEFSNEELLNEFNLQVQEAQTCSLKSRNDCESSRGVCYFDIDQRECKSHDLTLMKDISMDICELPEILGEITIKTNNSSKITAKSKACLEEDRDDYLYIKNGIIRFKEILIEEEVEDR